jgi:hypothetical protein
MRSKLKNKKLISSSELGHPLPPFFSQFSPSCDSYSPSNPIFPISPPPPSLQVALLATLLASASAFAPQINLRTATHLNSDAAVSAESAVEDAAPAAPAAPSIPTGFCRGYVGGEGPEPMIMPGFGTSKNFDPFGFADRAPEWVPWFREAELKVSVLDIRLITFRRSF